MGEWKQRRSWNTPNAVLPPSGYYAKLPDGKLEVFSALQKGKRRDFVKSPAYDFIDGRGEWFETSMGATDGQLIILKNDDGSREIIPYHADQFAVTLNKKPRSVMALDMERKDLGPAGGEFKKGMYFIHPVPGAVSYLVKFME